MEYIIFRFSQILCIVVNPLMIVYFIVLTLTWLSFGELSILLLLKRALVASMDALTFSIVDSIVSKKEVANQIHLLKSSFHLKFSIFSIDLW